MQANHWTLELQQQMLGMPLLLLLLAGRSSSSS
jgi:hypothetical protein